MNRTEAEKAAREIAEQIWPGRGVTAVACRNAGIPAMADIIERADAEWEANIHAQLDTLGAPRTDGDNNAFSLNGRFSFLRHGRSERPCGETAWVSVEERLPTESGNYLCFLDKSQLSQVTVSFYGDELFDADLENVGRVTYWATLPSPPTAEEGKK